MSSSSESLPEKAITHLKRPVTARYIAARAVQDVSANQTQLEIALIQQRGFAELESRDRAFARLLAATVFRRKGQIDQIVKSYLRQKPPPFVIAVLQISTVQLLFLKTPPHAAVGEAVNLIKQSRKTASFSGLVNAILRQVADKGPQQLAALPPRVNIPPWIWKSWDRAYGRASASRMATVLCDEPPLDITVKSEIKSWAEKLGGTDVFGQTVRLPKGQNVSILPGFDEGKWWVQDVAATLPVLSLGEVKGLTVLDLCAAPGGKTLQLAAAGAHVTALDKSASRLSRLQENLTRTKLEAKIIQADLLNLDDKTLDMDKEYDAVLLDAPCSATGTFRRHPDVLYNKTHNQLGELTQLQKHMLEAAAKRVRRGGVMIYCTCSLQPEEGERQIEQFLGKHSEFDVQPINLTSALPLSQPSSIADMKAGETVFQLTHKGFLRVTPDLLREKGGMDGFFIASLIKS